MKSMNDNTSSSSSNNDNNTNWLGFSLSPHMKMDVSTSSSSVIVPESFYLSNNSSSQICYGVGQNGSLFHQSSTLPVMPLKSDGSLCLMEAFSRSHTPAMGKNASPKLEDFLGGATMGSHQYTTSCNNTEAMALSLDSIFYNQVPFRQQNQYFSTLQCHEMYQAEQNSTQISGVVDLPNHGLINPTTVETRTTMGCGDLQSLSLSMSPGSQSSCVTTKQSETTECLNITENKKRGLEKALPKQTVHRKSIDTFGQRTSQYRGVTRHRWTGRYEAHLWDNSCKKEGQTRKGRQVYLGGYDMEEKAARAYDLAALKYWGPSTHINFPLENYQQELEQMKNMTRQEYVAHLRRKSSGFSRGASMYRGVTRHHQHGRWQARIGRVAGNKDLYLGTFSTQEEAAEAYDIAAIKFRGSNAVTNFDISRYDVEKIMASNTLPTSELARRNKEQEPNIEAVGYVKGTKNNEDNAGQAENVPDWKVVLYESPQEHQNPPLEPFHERNGNYRNPAFSMALQDLISIDTLNTGPHMGDESTAPWTTHFSNPSSIVTSLSSSREASPEKNGTTSTTLAPKPSSSTTMYISPTNNVGSWVPTAQLRPVALPVGHLPVFTAWGDA